MPANKGHVIDDLLGPVRTLNLRERAAAARAAEGADCDYRESAIRGQSRAYHRQRIRVHVCEVAVIGLPDLVAVSGITELVLTVESAAKLIDDPGIRQPGPMQSHHHRLGMSKRGPVILGRRIILRSQTFVIADEVFARNGVFLIEAVINLSESVMEICSADGRSRIRNRVPVLKYARVL